MVTETLSFVAVIFCFLLGITATYVGAYRHGWRDGYDQGKSDGIGEMADALSGNMDNGQRWELIGKVINRG